MEAKQKADLERELENELTSKYQAIATLRAELATQDRQLKRKLDETTGKLGDEDTALKNAAKNDYQDRQRRMAKLSAEAEKISARLARIAGSKAAAERIRVLFVLRAAADEQPAAASKAEPAAADK